MIYMIGNAHIDPIWLWQWQEGYQEVKATFQSALDRMDESEDFVFTAACAEESLGKSVALGYITSSGKCYARNGGDYIAQLIEMAGGDYVCADMAPDETGNTSMTFEEWYDKFVDADYLFYYNLGQEFYSIQDMIDYNPLFADFKAVQNGNVWVTCDGFSQKSADIVGVITDMNTVLTSEDNTVTTDFIVKIS